MIQPNTTGQTGRSGKEVAKWNSATDKAAFSRFSSSYWEKRLFRPCYSRDGQRVEVAEFYCRVQHAGRRDAVALGTNGKEEASRRAARFFKTLCQSGWQEALKELDPEKAAALARADSPTVGEFLAAVEKVWPGNPRTLRGYQVCLRWFVSRAQEIAPQVVGRKHKRSKVKAWREAVNAVRLDSLTPEAVEAVMASHKASAGHNRLAKATATRSVASLARQARSLFAPAVLKLLPWKKIASPFEGVPIESARPMRYTSCVDAGRLLSDARSELGEADPEAYKVILVCLGAGLRRAEADNLCWTQIDGTRNEIRVEVTATFEPKNEESANAVPVDGALVSELLRYRGAATGLHVLEGTEPKPGAKFACYRAEASEDRAIAWLRKQGLNVRLPLHTLRKEAGSLVNSEFGIHAASQFLRHADIGTTARHYSDNRNRKTVGVGALLGWPAAKQAKAVAQ
jgi:integrase